MKCGKCVELMVYEMNEQYKLFEHDLKTGNMLNQLKNDLLKKEAKLFNEMVDELARQVITLKKDNEQLRLILKNHTHNKAAI